MNKNFLLISLILMVSCFGIFGIGGESNAAAVDVEVNFFKAGVGEVFSADAGEEIIIQIIASAAHSPIANKPFEIDINGSPYKCSNITGGNCKFGVAGENVKCACETLYSFSSDGNYKITGTAYSNGNKNYSGSKTITIGNVPSMLPTEPSATPTNSIIIEEPTLTASGSTVNLSNKPLSKILEDLIKWLLQIVILIAILMIIVSGAMYMISAGDQKKADTAKKALTYAILGLLVVVLAYAIVDTLVDILS
jgi:hypothetical protein